MFSIAGTQECIRNVVTLATPFTTEPIRDLDRLGAALRGFYAHRGGEPPSPGTRIVTDNDELRDALRWFGLVAPEGPIGAGPHARELFDRAVDALDDDLRVLTRLVFADIALLDGDRVKAGSGVTYERLGLAYFSPQVDWTAQDVAECLVHESTHLLLHFDELCHGHYVDEARTAAQGDFARTAITGTPREAKVVFHSLVIAAEIAGLRRRRFAGAGGVHGTAGALRATALACGADLLGRADRFEHFTPRGLELAERAVAVLEAS